MNILPFVFGVILVVGCSNDRDTVLRSYLDDADSIIFNNQGKEKSLFFSSKMGLYEARIEYYSTGKLLALEGFMYELPFGHRYTFDPRANLKMYSFQGNAGTYEITILPTKIEEVGSPLVAYAVNNDTPYPVNDSQKITFFFSTFPRRNLDVQILDAEGKYRNLVTVPSQLMPYLLQADYKIGKNVDSIIFKVTASKKRIYINNFIDKRTFHTALDIK